MIDTGSMIFILNTRILKLLGMDEAHLTPANIEFSKSDGRKTDILRMVELPVWIDDLETVHTIYISPSLGRELRIERDWLKIYSKHMQ